MRDNLHDFPVIDAQHDLDVRMAQHLLEHPGQAMLRHRLVRVGEVPVVAIRADRHARRHLRVQFGRVEVPLLPSVVAEEFLVQLASHLRDDHVFRCLDLRPLLGERLEELVELERRELQPIETVDRLQVDRNRHELPVDPRLHAVLIRVPLGELRQVLEDRLRVRVEDVRPVLMHEDARVVVVVVRVPADMRAFVDNQDLLAGIHCQPFGHDAAGEAGADDEVIKHRPAPWKGPPGRVDVAQNVGL